jgi:hypothetical protein
VRDKGGFDREGGVGGGGGGNGCILGRKLRLQRRSSCVQIQVPGIWFQCSW